MNASLISNKLLKTSWKLRENQGSWCFFGIQNEKQSNVFLASQTDF